MLNKKWIKTRKICITTLNNAQGDDSGHRILQELAGSCGKNHRMLKEKARNHWKMGAVFPSGNFRIFPGDFRSFAVLSVRKRSEVTGKKTENFGQEYCFHEIFGSRWNRSFPSRIVRPRWYQPINAKKTQFVVFTHIVKHLKIDLYYEGTVIEQTKAFKYLGYWMDSKLFFKNRLMIS